MTREARCKKKEIKTYEETTRRAFIVRISRVAEFFFLRVQFCTISILWYSLVKASPRSQSYVECLSKCLRPFRRRIVTGEF